MNRFFRHLDCSKRDLRKMFSVEDLKAISQAIAASEAQHSGEIVFYIEPSLSCEEPQNLMEVEPRKMKELVELVRMSYKNPNL